MGAAHPLLVPPVDTAARRPLQIAVVTETYPPEVNGVALTLQRMLQGLLTRQHRVQLVRVRQHVDDLAQHTASFSELLLPGVRIPLYSHLHMGLPCASRLVRAWEQQRPDIVHIATEGPLGWSALRAAERLSLPVVSDFRTNFHAYSGHYGLSWLRSPIEGYLRRFHNRTACTMVPTPQAQGELQALGFDNLQVVARGVDTALFNPQRRSDALRRLWGAGPDDPVVLCVSRLASEKNIECVWHAFEAIARVKPKAKLVLVGDGPQRSQLQRLCRDAVFSGQRRGEALATHYASADLFVFASLTETFGNVVPEAMASGLPVLAYDCAAAGQLVRHGHNGWLAPLRERAPFIELASQAALDVDAWRPMGRHARASMQPLDWSCVIDDLERVLLSAVRHRAVQPIAPSLQALAP